MVQSIQEALESAAQTVEELSLYVTEGALADYIHQHPESSPEDLAKQIALSFHTVMEQAADEIRKTEIKPTASLVQERDRMVFDLALQMVKSRLYDEVRNPVVKPRKNFNQPLKKQGIWWTRIEEILKGLEQNPQDLFAHERSIWIQGWNLACQQAATLLRTTKAFVVDDDGHTRARRPEEYAQLIEDLEP
jgi:hypothetical protein